MKKYTRFYLLLALLTTLAVGLLTSGPSPARARPAEPLPARSNPAPAPAAQTGKLQLQGTNAHWTNPGGPHNPTSILYDQYNNPSTSGTSAQNFEAANDPFDDETADDFVVPAGQTWGLNGLDVAGLYYNGAGPAASVNVTFYSSVVSGTYSIPGAVVQSRPNQPYTNGANPGDLSVQISPTV